MNSACWRNVEQYSYFKNVNDWLFSSSVKLGCQVCCDCAKLGQPHSSPNLFAEWSTGTVGPYGDTKQKRQISLREKNQ